jgi:threonine dehydrogenase-like Zn-dependent dehydrogenase
MSIPHKRMVAVQRGDGTIRAVEQDLPELAPGALLVKVAASLVSPGTEVGGWHAFAAQRQDPQPRQEQAFGYSKAGVVLAVGDGVPGVQVGQRVACIGAGFALHSDYAVVPHNLCVALPDAVSFEQGAYAMLLATALQVVRRGQPQLGEAACVVGLGIVGLLTARLFQLAGCDVLGWDRLPARVAMARQWGVEAVLEDEHGPGLTQQFTRGAGLDAAVLAMAGECDETVDRLVQCMQRTPDGHPVGRIMVVGWPQFSFGPKSQVGAMNNIDIRRCARTGAGYHDAAWEYGPDYPPVFMRWTTQTNLQLAMRLVAEGKVNVDGLTTHRIRLAEVEQAIDAALDHPDEMLGVVFQM